MLLKKIKKKGKPIEIDAGSSADGKNVSFMIENALLVLFVKNNSFQLSEIRHTYNHPSK